LPGRETEAVTCPLTIAMGRRSSIGPSHQWSFVFKTEFS
jgi:hypothetical protein